MLPFQRPDKALDVGKEIEDTKHSGKKSRIRVSEDQQSNTEDAADIRSNLIGIVMDDPVKSVEEKGKKPHAESLGKGKAAEKAEDSVRGKDRKSSTDKTESLVSLAYCKTEKIGKNCSGKSAYHQDCLAASDQGGPHLFRQEIKSADSVMGKRTIEKIGVVSEGSFRKMIRGKREESVLESVIDVIGLTKVEFDIVSCYKPFPEKEIDGKKGKQKQRKINSGLA
jgi:hypothetical protein